MQSGEDFYSWAARIYEKMKRLNSMMNGLHFPSQRQWFAHTSIL